MKLMACYLAVVAGFGVAGYEVFQQTPWQALFAVGLVVVLVAVVRLREIAQARRQPPPATPPSRAPRMWEWPRRADFDCWKDDLDA